MYSTLIQRPEVTLQKIPRAAITAFQASRASPPVACAPQMIFQMNSQRILVNVT